MTSAYNHKTGQWEIGWPGRVSRYDVVYLTPPDDPMHGLPIGNGEVGALCWFEPSRIVIVVNKSDLWDDAEFGRFNNWKVAEEERSTTLRHGGRIIIDFHQPVFEIYYIAECTGRISLADASVSLKVSGPLGSVSFRAFVNDADGTLCCDIEKDLLEDTPVDVTVERYGSRMFHHWYASVISDATHGLAGTDSCVDEGGAYVTHQLTSGTFAMGCRVIDQQGRGVRYERQGAHQAVCHLSETSAEKFSLLAVVTSPQAENPVTTARAMLDEAESHDIQQMFDLHSVAWKTFWTRSLMDTGNEFIDNLWHLNMYYANSSQGGKYPGRFIGGGLWNPYRDFQAWGFYFHWNQQQTYWPLNAAGHHELADSYLDLRFNALPIAKYDARDMFGADGAAVSDVTERRGYNSQLEMENHTPVGQIAMDFWRQYRYTGDEAFLREKALPYMLEAAAFFETLFEKGDDGLYHAHKGTGYEGGFLLRDVVTEISAGKALYAAVLKALEVAGVTDPRSDKWRDIYDNLAPIMTITGREDVIEQQGDSFIIKQGKFAGDITSTNAMLAAGYGVADERVYCSLEPRDEPEPQFTEDTKGELHRHPLYRMHLFLQKLAMGRNPYEQDVPAMHPSATIFPYCEYSAIYPSGLIGILQKDTELHGAAANTAKLYASTVIGWDPMPIVLARLGLRRELDATIEAWPEFVTMFPNGLTGDGPQDIAGTDAPVLLRTFEMWGQWKAPRRHFKTAGMETLSVLSTALNESLLQSYDGTIRICPAVPENKTGRFTLHAVGGFVVSCEFEHGKPLWVALESRQGGHCTMANPWPDACVYCNGSLWQHFTGETIEFPTDAGERFMIVPEQSIIEEWVTQPIEYESNAEPRTGPAGIPQLGLPKLFIE